MINERFIDIRQQRKALDDILTELGKTASYNNSFIREKYSIVNSNGLFCGKYDRESDRILIDRWFLYDSLCLGDAGEIKNTAIHEEAHRQTAILHTRNSGKPDHWMDWLNIYLDMGGRRPQVYIKSRAYEHEELYEDVSPQDIENIIIISYGKDPAADKLFKRRLEIEKEFIYIDRFGNVSVKNKN